MFDNSAILNNSLLLVDDLSVLDPVRLFSWIILFLQILKYIIFHFSLLFLNIYYMWNLCMLKTHIKAW